MVSSNPKLHYSELRVVQHTDMSPDHRTFSRPFGRFSIHDLCRFCRNCSILYRHNSQTLRLVQLHSSFY